MSAIDQVPSGVSRTARGAVKGSQILMIIKDYCKTIVGGF